jgi:hypothetical protein
VARGELASGRGGDPGYVYLFTNAAMPNIIKIGLTRRDDVGERLRQLYTTGVPMPFECAYAARVPDCAKLERVLHRVFDDKRVSSQREFFTADPELARLIIDLVKLEERPLSDSEQGITPDQRQDIETEKARRAERLTFERLGLAAGTVLQFIKDPQITCQVESATKVRFRGEVMSPSGAALRVLHDLGYQWSSCAGSEYWTYEGVKLSALIPPA